MSVEYQTMQQRIDELAGKIVVKRRDNESVLRTQQSAIDKNEGIIGELRDKAKARRRALAKMLNKDKEVIEKALQDPKHRFQRLQCKRYDGYTAKQELNEDLCNEIKKLNHVKYQKECRRKRLADLELKLRDYYLLQESGFEEQDQMELRRLKSEIDKMNMKRNTAKYIHSCYIKSLRELTKTRSNVQNDLDNLQNELRKESAELHDLKQIQIKTTEEKNEAKSRVANCASQISNGQMARERLLKETGRRVRDSTKGITDGIAAIGFENDIMSSLMAKQRRKSMAASGKIVLPSIEKKSSMDEMEETMKLIQSATAASTPLKIAETYQREMEKYHLLCGDAGDIGAIIDEATRKLAETRDKLDQIRYEQKKENDDIENDIENLRRMYVEREEELDKSSQAARYHSGKVNSALEAIKSIRQKFEPEELEVGPGGDQRSEITITEALESLKIIEHHIKENQEDIEHGHRPGRVTIMLEPASAEDFQEKLFEKTYDDDIMISPMKRIKLPAEDGPIDSMVANRSKDGWSRGNESDEDGINEHYVSRESIKSVLKTRKTQRS